MTSSNGNIFRVTVPLCGEFTGPGEFPTQRPLTRSFDVFFDLRLNKLLSKQPWGWWFETSSRPLWLHRNEKCLCAMHLKRSTPFVFYCVELRLVVDPPIISIIYIYFYMYMYIDFVVNDGRRWILIKNTTSLLLSFYIYSESIYWHLGNHTLAQILPAYLHYSMVCSFFFP